MGDAKDILGLSKGVPPAAPGLDKRSKASKDAPSRKPEGISREVYALTGGVPPLIPTVDVAELKAKRKQAPSQKVTWSWAAFSTSARSDDLQLHHWTRVVDGVPPSGDHPYAKYNKAVELVRYAEEEYAQLLQHPKWSQEETAHLLDLCARFDLRFIVIADRYCSEGFPPFPERTVEELKERYYSVAHTLLIARARNGEEVPDSPLLREPYNPAHEIERKRALSLLLSQSRQQEQEEAAVLAEARRISEARRAAQAVQGFPRRPSAPSSVAGRAAPSEGASPSFTATPETSASEGSEGGAPASGVRPPRVYVRGIRLAQTLDKAMSTAGARMAKRIEQTLEELGVHLKPQVPTRAVCAEFIALRKEVVALHNLQKKVAWKENELALLRENPGAGVAPSLGTPKRVVRGEAERLGTRAMGGAGDPEGGQSLGERPGKREVGRKYLAEASPLQAALASQQKRNRKLKASGD